MVLIKQAVNCTVPSHALRMTWTASAPLANTKSNIEIFASIDFPYQKRIFQVFIEAPESLNCLANNLTLIRHIYVH